MLINGTYKIDHLIYKFDNFGSNDLIGSMPWKIDSYQIQADHYDLLVCNSDEIIDLNEYQLIKEEITGFFLMRLYQKENQIVLVLVRTSKEEIYLEYLVEGNQISLLVDKINDGGHIAFEYLIHIIQNLSIQQARLPIVTIHSLRSYSHLKKYF